VKFLFFTDVDGTLMDFNTYSLERSKEGISLLKTNGIPLVPVSSKTFEEMREIISDMGIHPAFAFENGCGIAYPSDKTGDYRIEVHGPGTGGLLQLLPDVEKAGGFRAAAVTSLTPEEINRITGLGLKRSVMAKKRMASLPFLIDNNRVLSDADIMVINPKIKSLGIEVTKGARFNHLVPSGCGKGEAVRIISRFYYTGENLVTGACGDSFNDLPMLSSVHMAYIVRRPDRSFMFSGKNVNVTEGVGPEGFTEAVKKFIYNIAG